MFDSYPYAREFVVPERPVQQNGRCADRSSHAYEVQRSRPLNYFSWRFVLMGQLFTTSLHDLGAMLGYWIHVIPCVLLLVFSYLFWARWAWLMLTLGIGLGVGMGFTNVTTGDSFD